MTRVQRGTLYVSVCSELPFIRWTKDPAVFWPSNDKNMKWYAKPELLKPRCFEIKEDPSVGFYLYVFEGDKCV